MLTLEIIKAILADVTFQDWDFLIAPMGEGFFLQVQFLAKDNTDPFDVSWSKQKGRKWYISRFATDAEVVQTALKATLSAQEHEVREQFLYKGKAIFGPHLNLERLLAVANDTVTREPVAA
jgi:hypothetical protein